MYRIFIVIIICAACNSTGKKSQPPAADFLLPFLKQCVNPLLQNLETAEAKRELNSILPLVKEKDNYTAMCTWLRCMAVVYQLENKPDSARFYVDQCMHLALEKDTTQRQVLAGKIQMADIMACQHQLDSALHYGREAYYIAQKIDTPGLPLICQKLHNIYEKAGDLPMQKKYLFEGFMYGLLERDNQIKSLAKANQDDEEMSENPMTTILRRNVFLVILGLTLYVIWRLERNERRAREESLRQQLLRGQIESHFLYNTVSGLQELIRKGDREDAIRFVQQLGRLYRLSLENARQPLVPLNNELDALTNYLKLQQSLFLNGFDFRIDVEGIPDGIMIPPMLLQPFAENAIVHGFAGQKEKGQINIHIKRARKNIYFIIEDNGRGLKGTELNNYKKRSLSTIITKERLKLLSRQTGTIAKLKIVDKKTTVGEPGVRIELMLPYRIEGSAGNVVNLEAFMKD